MVANQDLSGVTLNLVESLEDALACKRWLGERRPIMGVDTETGGLDWWRDSLRTIQVGDALTGWTIPVSWKGLAQEILREYEGPIVFHNVKFDLHFLETNDVPVRRDQLHDTRVMAHAVDALHSTGLKPLSARLIHPRAVAGEQALKLGMKENGWTWATVPATFGPYWQYAALDPVLTARLYEHFAPLIFPTYEEVYELEIACTLVLADMERRGARVDLVYCRDVIGKIEPFLAEMSSWIRAEFGIANPNSDAQCIEYLNKQGIFWSKKTKKGRTAFDKEVLKELSGLSPVVDALRALRDKSKLLKTYLLKYVELADSNDLIHPQTNPLGARTGRMSISRPSLQNLPRSQHPRNAIISRYDNGRIGLIDFDQIEMRLLAAFANETRMIEAIKYGDSMREAGHKGYDVHSMNARGIYHIPMDAPVPKKQRQVTKNSGFAIIYGAGEAQFARTAGIELGEAQAFLRQYAATYPRVIQFQNEIGHLASGRLSREGAPYVIAPSGRRHVSERDKIYALVNYLIQGCLPPETRVLTRAGWLPIIQFQDGQEVWTGERWATARMVNRGPATRVRLHLSDGRTFDCDERHELLVSDGVWPRWEKVTNLTPDIELVEDRERSWGREIGSVDDWYWLGRMLGDGSFSPAPASNNQLTCAFGTGASEEADAHQFSAWLARHGARSGIYTAKNGRSFQVTASSLPARTLLFSLGWVSGWKSRTKRIPPIVFTLDEQRRRAVIDGYYAADGHHRSSRAPSTIQTADDGGAWICSVNRQLLEDTRRLMQTVGLNGYVRESKIRGAQIFTLSFTRGHKRLFTTSVEYLEPEEMFTLAVDDERHAFSSEGLISKNTAADVMKRKIVELSLSGLTEHLIIPVHDELIYDLPPEVDAADYMRQVQAVMTERRAFAVPLTADVKLVQRWGEGYLEENEELWIAPDIQEVIDDWGEDYYYDTG